MRVGEHLHLHMARIEQGAFDEKVAVAEAGEGFGTRALQRGQQLVGAVYQPHAAPAATGHRLDHERVADALRFGGKGGVAIGQRRSSRAAQERPAAAPRALAADLLPSA